MSNSIYKSYVSKVAGVATGVAMLATAALPVGAQTVADLQAQLAALTAQLAALTGGSSSSTSGVTYTFAKNLQVGSTGEDVRMLQKVLNSSADTKVASTGAGSPGSETTYFGPATKAAVIKFQNKYASDVLTPVGLTKGTGFVGSATRAKLNAMSTSSTNPTTPTTPVTGGVSVSLAASSPAQGAVISGQGLARLAEYTFTNGSNTEAVVTKVTLNRSGISNDASFANVYLYQGGKRVGDSATVSSGVITFNDTTGLIRIPAGGSVTLTVRADVASTATGQVLGVSLASVTANVPVNGTFPIAGSFFSVATATLASADFNSTTLPSASSASPQTEYVVWQNTVSIGNQAVNLQALTLRNVGSIATGDINNFKLYVDGTQVSSASSMDANGYVNFDLTSAPKRLETGGRVIKVVADIVGGSTRTFSFQLRQTGDILLVDTQLNQPIVPTANGSTFSSRNATTATIDGGALSVSRASSSQSSAVTVGATGVKLATFEFRASGERVKIDNLNVKADTTGNNQGGLDNGQVFLNGVQIGSTKDLTENTNVNFTFGSSFIVEAGQTAVVDIVADTKTTTSTNYADGNSVVVSLESSTTNAQGLSSLNSLTAPSSSVPGNSVTFTASSLSASKYSGYGDQTRQVNQQNVKVGSFVLSAGSAEGVNVNTITIALSAGQSASIANLALRDNSTGSQIGSNKSAPSSSNSYGVNFTVAPSTSKVIDIYADILSDATAITTTVTALGTGSVTGSSASSGSAQTLQTITIGSGLLTLTADASDVSFPRNQIVVGKATNVKVGKFKFGGVNQGFTVKELIVKIPNGAASGTQSVALRYIDSNGVTQTTSPANVVAGAEPYASATFTGLSIYVPANDSTKGRLEVLANTSDLAISGQSGATLTVAIDYNNGFKADPIGGGTATTSIGTSDTDSGVSSFLRKSVPTFAKSESNLSATPIGGQAIYRFTVTPDAAGPIDLKKISFNVSTNSVSASTWNIYDEADSTTALNTTAGEVDQNGVLTLYAGTSSNSTTIEVNSARTFILKASTVTGWNAAGDYITIGIAQDTTATTTAAATTFTTEKLVWSDQSIKGATHSVSTADWTNGYLLKDLSGSTKSYNY